MTQIDSPETIQLGDLTITIVRNARRKRLALEIGTNGVLARAPERMRFKTIEKFVASKADWIKFHAKNVPDALSALTLQNGAILRLLNEDITLELILNKRGSAKFVANTLSLPVAQSARPIEASIKSKLVAWYKQQALICLRDKVAFYADEMSIELPSTMKVKVRDYKRRWGSCDHKGDLSFNWRIIMAPEASIDYVVVHELAHLKEFNHSPKFWKIVSAQMPQWKQRQQWLHDNGAHLYRI